MYCLEWLQELLREDYRPFPKRVSIALALAISELGPILVIALYTLVIDGLFAHRRKIEGYKSVSEFKDRLWEVNCTILSLSLLLAQGAAFVITGTMKNLVGRPRPGLIDRCSLVLEALMPLFLGCPALKFAPRNVKLS